MRRRPKPSNREEDREACAVLTEAMRMLATMSQATHGRPPFLEQLLLGRGGNYRGVAEDLMIRLAGQSQKLAQRRKTKSAAAVRRWAERAPLALAHKATKDFEAVTALTASPNKQHLGCRTPQIAADSGAKEWGPMWGNQGYDMANEVLKAVEALEVTNKDFDDFGLPDLDNDVIYDNAMKIRASTATSTDGLRPRHVALLTRLAREGLARVLKLIERCMRWPKVARAVIAVALAKKTGGSRLVGVSTALYRLWAKIRYSQCRTILEGRISRPFLTAAPQRGAEKAAFELAYAAEVAMADGDQTATTMVDMAQFFEHVRADEYHRGGRQVGIPQFILSLTTHLYLGPRRIRVKKAYSEELYPVWSVLPGVYLGNGTREAAHN